MGIAFIRLYAGMSLSIYSSESNSGGNYASPPPTFTHIRKCICTVSHPLLHGGLCFPLQQLDVSGLLTFFLAFLLQSRQKALADLQQMQKVHVSVGI